VFLEPVYIPQVQRPRTPPVLPFSALRFFGGCSLFKEVCIVSAVLDVSCFSLVSRSLPRACHRVPPVPLFSFLLFWPPFLKGNVGGFSVACRRLPFFGVVKLGYLLCFSFFNSPFRPRYLLSPPSFEEGGTLLRRLISDFNGRFP